MSQGHYFIYTDKDIDEYEEEFKSIDGVKQFRLECGARIAINGRDNCDSGIVGCNRDFYNFLREKNPWMVDFDTFEEGDKNGVKPLTGFTKSNVLKYFLEDGSWIAVRPSGTEPKIKIYYCIKGESSEDALDKAKKYEAQMKKLTA